MPSVPADFVAEATETVEAFATSLAVLDARRGEDADPESINAIFRSAHSLKGLAGLFGQERLSHLAHVCEDVLDRLRLGKVALTDEVLDALIEVADVFQLLLREAQSGQTSNAATTRATALASRLQEVGEISTSPTRDVLDQAGLDEQLRSVLTEYEEHRLRVNLRKGHGLFRIGAKFDLATFDEGLAEIAAKLKPAGELISTLPSPEPAGDNAIAFDLLLGSAATTDELQERISGLPASLTEVPLRLKRRVRKAPEPDPVEEADEEPTQLNRPEAKPKRKKVAASSTEPTPAPAVRITQVEGSLRSLTQTVRVDIRKLDSLMNAVGELLLIKGNLQRLGEQVRGGGALVISKLWGQELTRETRLLERKLDEIQKGLLEARMVPLGQVFEKLERLVRKVARESKKEIDFRVSGGDVELDKLIVEELSDPLMHIIRNAIDHGVERPEARERAGKARRGAVRLRAFQRGNQVVIEVQDDGSGIDTARVKDVALRRGLISTAEAAQMTERDLHGLIFLPGFSTARSVSELSGRGVGLDVVKTNIANLAGLIDVESRRGEGSTFSITLPVTLAIIRALVVRVSGRVYAVPLNSVLEILSVAPEELHTIERREVLSLRGQTLPFARLTRLFRHPEQKVARHFVVVVGLAQDRLGLAVDELMGQQDIVIKPLGGRLRGVRGVAGATDLGDRRTVLVLDVGALMEEVLQPERASAGLSE